MSHFTQLGLSGEADRKPTNKTAQTNSGAAPGPGSSENQPGARNSKQNDRSHWRIGNEALLPKSNRKVERA